MKTHESPGKRDFFVRGEAQRLQDLKCLLIQFRIARGSGGQDMGHGAIGSNAYKKRRRIEGVGGRGMGKGHFNGSVRQA
jgi:hypothetical protein